MNVIMYYHKQKYMNIYFYRKITNTKSFKFVHLTLHLHVYLYIENLYSMNKGHFILYIYLQRVSFPLEIAIYYKTVLVIYMTSIKNCSYIFKIPVITLTYNIIHSKEVQEC